MIQKIMGKMKPVKNLVKMTLLFGFSLLSYPTHSADAAFSSRPDVKNFIHEMVKTYHFKEADLITTLNSVKLRPAIISSFKAPLEQKPWHTYQMMFITEWRIREGLVFWKKYRTALARAEKKYGIPASIIVATIGIETKYGRNIGQHRVIDALANLAFNNTSRSTFFRNELKEFLLLAREQHLSPLKIMGSYAGAIGQPQFMPSSYRRYAVNFSGNKKIDLSTNEIDVIGSIANYYHQHGWINNQPVAIPATLKTNQYQFLLGSKNKQHFSQLDLAKHGIQISKKLSPQQEIMLIELQGHYRKEYWIGFHNFNVIKRYNSSNLYAMAVYQLSYYISQLKERLDNA